MDKPVTHQPSGISFRPVKGWVPAAFPVSEFENPLVRYQSTEANGGQLVIALRPFPDGRLDIPQQLALRNEIQVRLKKFTRFRPDFASRQAVDGLVAFGFAVETASGCRLYCFALRNRELVAVCLGYTGAWQERYAKLLDAILQEMRINRRK